MRSRLAVPVLFCAVVALPLLLAGCKKKPATDSGEAVDVMGQLASKPLVAPTQLAEADAAFDLRHTREGTEEAIRLYEEALAADPDRADARDMRVRLGVLYYGVGYFYDRDQPKKKKMEWYLQGRDHALEAMKANPEFAAALEEGTRLQDAVPLLQVDDMDATYWAALNWSRWGEQKGILRVAMDIPKVRAMNERILELSEDYFAAAVHRFFGAFFVAIPPFAGQDVPRSKAHFERAMELAPGWTETNITYAEYYATHVGDRELYVSLLEEVLATPIPDSPVYRFEFEVARVDAEQMLARTDRLFDDP